MSEEKKPTIKAPIPDITKRIIAFIIDSLIISAIVVVLEIIATIFWSIGFFAGISALVVIGGIFYALLSIAGVVLSFFYFAIYPLKRNGQTLGRKMQNLQLNVIVDEAKGKVRPMGPEDRSLNIKRTLYGIVDMIAWGLVGLYFISQSPNGQNFTDQQNGTVVILLEDAPAKPTTTTKSTTTKSTTTKTEKPAK
ncbi:MAG: RDD family protein [Asgard group archaeon]|nr:RDD family protein [Asgard group archaeon]